MGVVTVAWGAVLLLLGGLILAEHRFPARSFEAVPGWRLKCLAFVPMIVGIPNLAQFALNDLLVPLQLLPGQELGTWSGAAVGIVASELLVYWAHRWHHSVHFLWRWVHQLHHAAERVDAYGAAYFHPFEVLEGTLIGLFLFRVVLGLSPEATGLAMVWQAFVGAFQHGNIRTPTWLGYVIQRPEQHAIHHERGVHGFNYANLPLWDVLFGTFRNPQTWEGVAGFYSGASNQTLRMLRGHDIVRERSTP
jgi:sterol desaturase/sphingolipid hydroxylase (fatty acid hydroxylase superfamily)